MMLERFINSIIVDVRRFFVKELGLVTLIQKRNHHHPSSFNPVFSS